ncbi:MAG: citrate/2-methylcitrate synthase [Phycisphaerae bacterium]|nr:citrate/2-methylcitrate synthase [Phycisphaerae bacterium]
MSAAVEPANATSPKSSSEAAPTKPAWDKGLANTVAAETEMSFIDGAKGILEYVGIDIDSLARHSTFEETVFLLWNRRLPKQSELSAFEEALRAEYDLAPEIYALISKLPTTATPMHALRTLVSALGTVDPDADDTSIEANQRAALKLVAKTPALIANFDLHRKGKPFAKPDRTQNIAGSFLTMLTGHKPTAAMVRALDVCLILHADHGLNASTFAARVTIATLSDMYSAMTTAVGTLKGPLHGGANEEVMVMLNEIGSLDRVEAYIKDKLANKSLVMGFGHRVYKTVDPRATYLKTFSKQVATDTGNEKLYELSTAIEKLMAAEVGSKGIWPNVDFYSATTYHSLGLELDLFTPMFAMSRISGWSGHCIEQLRDNRLIRPAALYVGPHAAKYVPMSER